MNNVVKCDKQNVQQGCCSEGGSSTPDELSQILVEKVVGAITTRSSDSCWFGKNIVSWLTKLGILEKQIYDLTTENGSNV